MEGYSHFDEAGRPRMVDVGGKGVTKRAAAAECLVELPEKVYDALVRGGVSKGDPMSMAEIGGIMAAKRTSDLIPLCHQVKLDAVSVKCALQEGSRTLRIECEASASDVTGVEMEALVGATVAALVFYDMCKALDKGMEIRGVRLLRKSGGKSGAWVSEKTGPEGGA
jgi:cyclic pyranopterin phosphate synthase